MGEENDFYLYNFLTPFSFFFFFFDTSRLIRTLEIKDCWRRIGGVLGKPTRKYKN